MGVPADHTDLGDPAGMESLAAELQLRAGSIAGVAASLGRQIAAMTFEGPGADRLRSEMQERRKRADRIASELQDSAHTLRRAASSALDQIHEIRLADKRARERRGK